MKLFASGRKKHLEGSGRFGNRFGKACGKIARNPSTEGSSYSTIETNTYDRHMAK